MFRNTIWFGALLFLSGAVLFWTAGPTLAAHGGHGGGGGFHGGGFHGGGFHAGGFNRGIGYDEFRSYYGSYGNNRPTYYYGNYYPGYSSYLYSGYYPYSSYSSLYPYASYSSLYPSANLTLGTAGNGPAYGQNLPPTTDGTAHIQLRVPPDAEVWFAGTKTTSAGPIREFQSPALEPGGQYIYEVRARWMEDGKEVAQTQKVKVWAGANLDVRFPVPPGPAPEPVAQPEKQPSK